MCQTRFNVIRFDIWLTKRVWVNQVDVVLSDFYTTKFRTKSKTKVQICNVNIAVLATEFIYFILTSEYLKF